MQELQTEKLRFTYQLRGPDELRTHEAVREAVQECEILIEQISRPGCGFLALEALALGKTVLSGNDPAVQQRFPHLLACPVLHATRENLTTRLRLVLREPKCLRDFGKRGRAYIERFHESNHVAKLVLQYYQRPTTRAATSAEQRGELSRH